MKTIYMGLSRLRRDLNTVVRKLTSGEVDIYVVTRRGKKIIALVSYETAVQWQKELERIVELTHHWNSEQLASSDRNTKASDPDQEDRA